MSDKENDNWIKIFNKLEELGEDVAEIRRGVHGDPVNGVDGLIKENKNQEIRIKALEAKTEKIETWKENLKWWVGKIAAGVSVLIAAAWTLVKQRFGL